MPLDGPEFDDMRGFISNTVMAAVVEVFFNGIYTAIIVTTVCIVVSRHGLRHILKPLTLLIIMMYTFAAVNAWGQMSNVVTTLLHEELSVPELRSKLISTGWRNVFVALAYPLNGFIADCIMIWRCYIIWGRNKRIIVLASILTFAQIPFTMMTILWDFGAFSGYHQTFAFFKMLSTTSTCLSLASTVLTTALIMYRIITVGGWRYFPFIEIMVESALLYSVALLCVIPFCFIRTNHVFIPAAVNRQITGIAPTLIIARLLLGVKALERKYAATTSGLRNPTNSHPLSTVRFHPSFTDPTKTEGVDLSGGSESTDDPCKSGPGELSHTFSKSRFCSRGESGDDDVDGIWVENAPRPPPNASTGKISKSHEWV